jgi:hypothetical protein
MLTGFCFCIGFDFLTGHTMTVRIRSLGSVALAAAVLFAGPASAADTVKVGLLSSLSGHGA